MGAIMGADVLLGHDANCAKWIRKFSGDRFAAQSHGGVEAGGVQAGGEGRRRREGRRTRG
jgi:hypothetical protein